jgi:1-acyl-sn-glycerol-3-phosphate acyltransferase
MNLYGNILRLFGWKVDITVPERSKSVICVAPHTSNWDFIIGLFAYNSIGRKAGFLMKQFWFFFPIGYLMRALGGIPVPRHSNTSLTELIVKDYADSTKLNLAITPEGTRSAVTKWRSGFLYIAHQAKVPIQLGVIDYKHKCVTIHHEFTPTGDIEADMAYVKAFYSAYADVARYPEKFTV